MTILRAEIPLERLVGASPSEASLSEWDRNASLAIARATAAAVVQRQRMASMSEQPDLATILARQADESAARSAQFDARIAAASSPGARALLPTSPRTPVVSPEIQRMIDGATMRRLTGQLSGIEAEFTLQGLDPKVKLDHPFFDWNVTRIDATAYDVTEASGDTPSLEAGAVDIKRSTHNRGNTFDLTTITYTDNRESVPRTTQIRHQGTELAVVVDGVPLTRQSEINEALTGSMNEISRIFTHAFSDGRVMSHIPNHSGPLPSLGEPHLLAMAGVPPQPPTLTRSFTPSSPSPPASVMQ